MMANLQTCTNRLHHPGTKHLHPFRPLQGVMGLLRVEKYRNFGLLGTNIGSWEVFCIGVGFCEVILGLVLGNVLV